MISKSNKIENLMIFTTKKRRFSVCLVSALVFVQIIWPVQALTADFAAQHATADRSAVFVDLKNDKARNLPDAQVLRNIKESFKKQKPETRNYVPGEVLVKFKEHKIDLDRFDGETKAQRFANQKSLSVKNNIKKSNISVLKTEGEESVEDMVNRLKNNPDVEYVQPNYQYSPRAIDTNDTDRGLLWGLDNADDNDIDAPEAWEISEGNGVVVAVIDDGVAYNHPDLVANMWDGSNCVDENGDFLSGCNHGYDFENNDKTPLPTDSSHGTHIAGTIAAVGNNGMGIIGVAPKAQIMAVKFGYTSATAVSAINFAGENSAKVINASWGLYGTDSEYYDTAVYDSIRDFPGLFIVAAGNFAFDHDEGVVSYPDGFKLTTSIGPGLDNIMVVAATDQNDNLSEFSDYGATSVDVGAPGVSIYSTVVDSDVYSEDFEEGPPDVVTSGITDSNWMIGFDGSSQVAYSDNSGSYEPDAHTWLIQDGFIDLSGTEIVAATLDFTIWCDTPVSDTYDDFILTNYFSNGEWHVSEIYDEDRIFWDGGMAWTDTGYQGYYNNYTESLSDYLTDDFRFGFDWITDSSIDDNYGCAIDDIVITKYTNGSDEQYDYGSGTSMAAPHVVGLAALIMGHDSGLTYSEVKDVILETGDTLASLVGKTVTGKRVNAHNALNSLVPTGTEVSGNITENTTWTLANSPYHITNTVSVYPDITLTIEPGVIVMADAEKYLQIAGTLIARGEEDNLITFTSYEAGGSWGGIKFIDSAEDAQVDENYNYISGSIIEYTDVNSGLSWDCIRIEGASPFISHSEIHNCANGIFIYNYNYPDSSNAVIYSNTIRDIPTGYGIQQINKVSDTGLVKIINNEINNTGTGIVSRNGQGPNIIGNTITNNKRGIDFESSSDFLAENNVINIPATSQETSIGINITSNSVGTVQYNDLVNDANVQPSNSALNIHSSDIIVRFNTLTANSASTIRVNCLGIINCSVIDSNNIYNTTTGGYAIWNWGDVDINVSNNYWGTTNSADIDNKIFDFYDDPSLGRVIYNPFAFAVIDPFDETPPLLSEVISVLTPTNDNTPDYTFSSDEAGTITYDGECSSATTAAIAGNNTITFDVLDDGAYDDCAITVTDTMGNESLPLSVSSFTVDTTPPVFTISGTVYYYDGIKVVPDATVILEDADGIQLAATITDTDGFYEFTGVDSGGDYVVRIEKDDDDSGVAGTDLTKIRRHIVGLETFDSIFKIIASDVNNSGTTSGTDLTKIRRYIVEIEDLPSNGWRFYTNNATITTENYLTDGLVRTIDNLNADTTGQDFTGVKMGDVNNSWNAS